MRMPMMNNNYMTQTLILNYLTGGSRISSYCKRMVQKQRYVGQSHQTPSHANRKHGSCVFLSGTKINCVVWNNCGWQTLFWWTRLSHSLSHAQVKKQLHDPLERVFNAIKEKAPLLQIILAPSGQMIGRQRGTRTSPVVCFVLKLTFLSTTSTFALEARCFTNGHQCKNAPLLADLFLHTFEYDFMVKTMKQDITKATLFSNAFRYIDDLFSINNVDLKLYQRNLPVGIGT